MLNATLTFKNSSWVSHQKMKLLLSEFSKAMSSIETGCESCLLPGGIFKSGKQKYTGRFSDMSRWIPLLWIIHKGTIFNNVCPKGLHLRKYAVPTSLGAGICLSGIFSTVLFSTVLNTWENGELRDCGSTHRACTGPSQTGSHHWEEEMDMGSHP